MRTPSYSAFLGVSGFSNGHLGDPAVLVLDKSKIYQNI